MQFCSWGHKSTANQAIKSDPEMPFCIQDHKSTAAQATKSDPEMQFCIQGHKSTAAQAIKYDPYKQFIFCLLGHNYIQNLPASQSPGKINWIFNFDIEYIYGD